MQTFLCFNRWENILWNHSTAQGENKKVDITLRDQSRHSGTACTLSYIFLQNKECAFKVWLAFLHKQWDGNIYKPYFLDDLIHCRSTFSFAQFPFTARVNQHLTVHVSCATTIMKVQCQAPASSWMNSSLLTLLCLPRAQLMVSTVMVGNIPLSDWPASGQVGKGRERRWKWKWGKEGWTKNEEKN